MSVRVEYTGNLLKENHTLSKYPLPAITWKDISTKGLQTKVREVYANLGGRSAIPSVLFPAYDLEFESLAVQVDEERNFNRYRAVTLQSSLYQQLPFLPLEKYRSYCRTFEQECLKSASFGHHWSSAQSEQEFGKAGEKGDLYKEGAPSWKYRAFQDFLIDLVPLIFPVDLVRFCIYDNILINNKMYRLKDIITSARTDLRTAMSKNFERRIQASISQRS